jgi:hypothetical protein
MPGGVLYAIVERGNIREENFTSRAAIEEVKNSQLDSERHRD